VSTIVVPHDIALALFFAWLRVLVGRSRIASSWANPLAALSACLVLSNVLLAFYLLRQPFYTMYVLFVIIGAGSFLLSTRWLAVTLAVAAISWAAVAVPVTPPNLLVHYAFATFVTTLLTISIHAARLRAYRRLHEALRAANQELNERVTAERALSESEERHRALSDFATEGIMLHERGRILDANRAFGEIVGRPARDLVGTGGMATIPFTPESQELVADHMRRGSDESYEIALSRPGAAQVFAETQAKDVDYRGRRVRLVRLLDITKERQARLALAESERRFRLLLQNSNDIIQVIDAAGLPSYTSDQVTRILGYRPDQLAGKPVFAALHPDDRPAIAQLMAEGLGGPGAVRKAEFRLRHKDGSWIEMEAIGCNLLHDPIVNGIVLNVRDISERRRAEAERNRLEAQLRQALKMEAVGRLAGGVAHDFNNLLTAIIGNVQLALMRLPKADPLTDRMREIGQAAESAATLTRQLLSFSRKQAVEPRVLDLNELIAATRTMLARLIGEDVALTTAAARDLAPVNADPGQLEQVLVNLAINARDAMPGGGSLHIETADVELDAASSREHPGARPGRYAMMTVRDTGCGMSDEVKAHLFEPFFTTKEKGKGTGLGLAISYGAVNRAGGVIDVVSEVDRGTTFRILLPVVAEKPRPRAPLGLSTDVPGGRETILLAEDDGLVREAALAILQHLGYTVLDAASGEDALRRAAQHAAPIQLLLTDLVMPGMSGRDLAAELARIQPQARVLYTSGHTDKIIVHDESPNAADDFLGKPYVPESLARKVREILDR
jgi:PAS domain S-box-containing protein